MAAQSKCRGCEAPREDAGRRRTRRRWPVSPGGRMRAGTIPCRPDRWWSRSAVRRRRAQMSASSARGTCPSRLDRRDDVAVHAGRTEPARAAARGEPRRRRQAPLVRTSPRTARRQAAAIPRTPGSRKAVRWCWRRPSRVVEGRSVRVRPRGRGGLSVPAGPSKCLGDRPERLARPSGGGVTLNRFTAGCDASRCDGALA